MKKVTIFGVLFLAIFILIGTGCENKEEAATEKDAEENTEDTVTDIKIGPVENNLEDLEQIQTSVDKGSQPWRLDPHAVALADGVTLGFNQQEDTFTLISKTEIGEYSGTGEAEVEATHGDKTYIIQLIQPVKQGKEGIWTINSVREK